MAQSQSGSLALNYSDVFISFHFNEEQTCRHTVKDHMLVYVYSGQLLIEEGDSSISVHSGECVFLSKNHRVGMTNKPYQSEQFRAIFLVFNRNFLREYYRSMNKSKLTKNLKNCDASLISVTVTPSITGLFQSMVPYFDSNIKPSKELIDIKLNEGIQVLLDLDIRSSASLFDFVEPWKISLK